MSALASDTVEIYRARIRELVGFVYWFATGKLKPGGDRTTALTGPGRR